MRWLALSLVLLGCGASQAQREACYAKNEAAATERALRECPGSWKTCPARPAIIEELKASHARCP